MSTIYLVRHGQTKWNKENRLQGWKDSPLTDIGVKHAQLLGQKLANVEFDAIYSSPIERAVRTAEYVRSGRNIPIQTEENLKEINFGEWEGKKKADLEQNSKENFNSFWNAPHKYDHRPHKGENITDFQQRVAAAVKKIIADHSSGNILVVTHGVVVNALLSFLMGLPTEKMWDHPDIHNTSLTVFHWDGQTFQIDFVGDTSHYEKGV